MMKHFRSLLLLGMLMGMVSPLTAEDAVPYGSSIQWELKVPMRDGTKLAAVVYRPRSQKEPLPVILTLTPYTSRSTYSRGRYFSEQGYVFVSVDTRGRGNSEGEFDPFMKDGQDGYDLVEWLAKQSWCNGKVGMWGGSYLGFTQWATAKEFPPHLATIVPVASPYLFKDFPTNKGIDSPFNAQWLTFTYGQTDQQQAFGDDSHWSATVQDFKESGLPFRQIDRFAGIPSEPFQRWLNHPMSDSYWASTVPNISAYQRFNIPILTITGHYDDDQNSALTYFRDHERNGTAASKLKHFVVIGPWDHSGTRTPTREYEGVDLGPGALVDLNALHKAWYDWTLKGGSKPDFLKARVACYVVGPNEWTYANGLGELTTRTQTLFLHSNGRMDSALSTQEPSSRIQHDPADQRPNQLEGLHSKTGKLTLPNAALISFGRQFFDQSLVFTTEPFLESVILSGNPRFTAWVCMDVPDEDFFAALFEVLPDGSVVQLSQDVLRARYRDSITTEKLVFPGEPTRLEFRDFPFFARRIGKGSRLKLVFGSITTPWAQMNCHTGKVVADEMPKDARVAHIELRHDTDHASVLTLPFGPKIGAIPVPLPRNP
jgi:hypothetical protein